MIPALISYAYIGKRQWTPLIEATKHSVRWLLDSGAFTAYEQGHPIRLDDYVAYLQAHRDAFDMYIALDVIEDSRASKRNLERMAALGLRPMGVLTTDEHTSEAVDIAAPSASICVAGGTYLPLDVYRARLAAVRAQVGPDVWIHALGFARGLEVATTQANGIDASSWMAGPRWGTFQWFDGGINQMQWGEMRKRPFAQLPPGAQEALVRLSVPSKMLADPKGSGLLRGANSLLGAQCMEAWSAYAVAMAARGVRYYFALAAPEYLVSLLALGLVRANGERVAWHAWRARVAQAGKAVKRVHDDPLELQEVAAEAAAGWEGMGIV